MQHLSGFIMLNVMSCVESMLLFCVCDWTKEMVVIVLWCNWSTLFAVTLMYTSLSVSHSHSQLQNSPSAAYTFRAAEPTIVLKNSLNARIAYINCVYIPNLERPLLEVESARSGDSVVCGISCWVEPAVHSELGSGWLESSEMFDFPLILAINSSLLASWVGIVTEAGSGDLLLLLLETPTRSRGLLVLVSTISRAFVARLVVVWALGCICVDGCCGCCGNFWLGACVLRTCLVPP